MPMDTITAEKRDLLGKKVKTLRKKGILPAVVYGNKQESMSISVRENDFVKLWKTVGEASIISLEVDGKKENVLIHSIAFDPVKDNPIHVDFFIVDMDKPAQVDVPIEFVGESEAIKAGGTLIKVMHTLKIEALPKNLPHSIEIDISVLKEHGSTIAAKNIKVAVGVKILCKPDDIVVLIEAPRKEEDVVEEAPSLENIERVGEKSKTEESVSEESTDGANQGKEKK